LVIGQFPSLHSRVLEGKPFRAINVGEDIWFVRNANTARIVVLQDPSFHVGIINEKNTSPKQVDGPWWQPQPIEEIRRLFGSDWDYYQARYLSRNPHSLL
jgi:hypothetical protein